jgi:hypothetical protein
MNRLYQFYFWLPNFAVLGKAGKVINVLMAMLLKRIFDFFLPAYYQKNTATAAPGINTIARQHRYVVSITSFPARIDEIWVSMETVLRQSFKPDMIVLWLATSQFPDKKIPESLAALQQRGLTIKFCDEDLRSHKKYFYALQQFPDDYIITLDDDLYYHQDVLKNIVDLHQKNPAHICTNRAHQIGVVNGALIPYRQWNHNAKNILAPTHRLLQTGGAGTLYFPGALHPSVTDKSLIKTLCFHADDVWLKMMCFVNGKKILTNKKYNKDYITVSKTQTEKLVNTNVIDGGNDTQLAQVMAAFNVLPNDFLKDN